MIKDEGEVKSLERPKFLVAQVVETCAGGMRDRNRARILRDAQPQLVQAEGVYVESAERVDLCRLAKHEAVTQELDKSLMKTIYKSHFVATQGREYYSEIRLAPKHGKCPLCGQRIVSTVDHYLPQDSFPIFNITPANLIPACSDCNKKKLHRVASRPEEQTLHPYFDDLGEDRWLAADVMEVVPPALTFRVKPVAYWSPLLAARVDCHFKVMGLAELYGAHASAELSDASHALLEVGRAGGESSVRAHLNSVFRSCHAADPNSWRTAAYAALRDSAWFCSEGYSRIR